VTVIGRTARARQAFTAHRDALEVAVGPDWQAVARPLS
jgi:hypothetical protein